MEKPVITIEHNLIARVLGWRLREQLPLDRFDVVVDQGRVNRSDDRYYIPDVFLVPMEYVRRLLADPAALEAYGQPLPLVADVRSPSTGRYDVTEKLAEYKRRGDTEIWLVHPYERTLTVWRRGPHGAYTEARDQGGVIEPVALPGVSINLDALFDRG